MQNNLEVRIQTDFRNVVQQLFMTHARIANS
jgi:hypothetical protein